MKQVKANLTQHQECNHESSVEKEDGASTDVRLRLWNGVSSTKREETITQPSNPLKSLMCGSESKSAFVRVDILKPRDMFVRSKHMASANKL